MTVMPPIPIWTEPQIRVALKEVLGDALLEWQIEVVIDRLKLFHLGVQ